jgi:5'-deoxynucleotidase
MNPVRAYLSGSVQRWHQNPALARAGQSLADHQGRCVHLLLVLHPNPSAALIRAMATHDGGELDAGDLGLPFKRDNPELARAHAVFETGAREAIFGPDPELTRDEACWVGLVDKLEAACWVLLIAPDHYARVVRNELWILGEAKSLGCFEGVGALLGDLKGGRW